MEFELVWTINRWRTVLSGTWKYDDPRLNMSLEGASRVWHVQPRVVLFPCPTNDCGHWIHRTYLVEWYQDSVFIYIIVGEWYRSHICGRSSCLRCTSCTRRRVQSAEKQVWPLLPTTRLLCVIRLPEVVSLYYTVVCRLTCLKLTTKSAIF